MSYYGNNDRGRYREDNRDRSRSRDFNDRRGGRGGGGGGRGPGGRGGRGSRGNKGPRPQSMEVTINYFPIKIIESDLLEWYMYDISVLDVRRVKKKDPETDAFLDPFEFEFVPIPKKNSDMSRFPEPLLRRIIKSLKEEHQFQIVTDGRALCYSNKKLFEKENSTSANPGTDDATGLSVAGRYGPADSGGHNVPLGPNDVYNDYFVRTKKNVSENDPDADKVKNSWYRVRLKEVASIPFAEVRRIFEGRRAETEYLHRIKQCTEIMMKSGQFAVMNSYGKSPRKFYFPEDVQHEIMGEMHGAGRRIADEFYNHKTIMPNIGLESRVRICSNGNAYLNIDSCIDYFYREYGFKNPRDLSDPKPVPVLNKVVGTLAGVRLNFNYPIPDHQKKDVVDALKKLTFHVTYVRKKSSEEWLRRKRELGWNEKKIERANTQMRKNCRMKKISGEEGSKKEGIIWSADDESEHCFTTKDRPKDGETEPQEVKHTICSYFLSRYGIKLMYPKMPCVFIGKREWFPVEFLFQGPGKAKYDKVQERKLNYYDEVAGIQRNHHTMSNCRRLANLLNSNPEADMLRQFGMRRGSEPVTLRAKLLPEPELSFKTGPAQVNDGKWDLRNKRFKTPADLSSFAFINMGKDSSKGENYIMLLLRKMEEHGITLPTSVDCTSVNCSQTLRAITLTKYVHVPSPDEIYDAFQTAIEKCKDFFLYDKTKVFKRNGVWFKTRYLKGEKWVECLVIPPPENIDTDSVGIMLRDGPTHMLNEKQVRLMAGCEINGKKELVDPFDIRFSVRGGHERHVQDRWEKVKFVKHIFVDREGSVIDDDPQSAMPIEIIVPNRHNIEIISMVFVFLPTDESTTYSLVKLMSQFEFGVPSQCCVETKFPTNKNPNQFLSNIALKLNTKLMNSSNRAHAWTTSGHSNINPSGVDQMKHGIPWVNETPTMVIGISLSHGIGQDTISVIGASVGLDECLMQLAQLCRVQSKSDMISGEIMTNITKTLLHQFLVHNETFPQRVLIYRNGSSDGDFDKIREREIEPMRLGLLEAIREESAENWCPPITYVVCQTQHSICMTPRMGHEDVNNVWSGTCVDDVEIMDYQDGQLIATKGIDRNSPPSQKLTLFEDVEENGYDFILTSHGGLKGTSKPIYYRVVLNENAVWKPADSCTPLTKEKLQLCTYHQSFQYGTATNAVRAVPVVHYSTRIANQFMGYVNYARHNNRRGPKTYDQHGYPLVRIDTEDEDEQREQNERGRNNNSRYYYVHKSSKELSNFPACVTQELQESFSPYDMHFGHKFRPPLRPHMSA